MINSNCHKNSSIFGFNLQPVWPDLDIFERHSEIFLTNCKLIIWLTSLGTFKNVTYKFVWLLFGDITQIFILASGHTGCARAVWSKVVFIGLIHEDRILSFFHCNPRYLNAFSPCERHQFNFNILAFRLALYITLCCLQLHGHCYRTFGSLLRFICQYAGCCNSRPLNAWVIKSSV